MRPRSNQQLERLIVSLDLINQSKIVRHQIQNIK